MKIFGYIIYYNKWSFRVERALTRRFHNVSNRMDVLADRICRLETNGKDKYAHIDRIYDKIEGIDKLSIKVALLEASERGVVKWIQDQEKLKKLDAKVDTLGVDESL